MPLSATAITETILALERRLDLDDPVWTEDDVHWWPLYRTEIYWPMPEHHLQAGPLCA